MCYVEYSSNSTDHGSKELPTIMKTAVQVLKYYLQISYIDLFSDLFLNKLAHKELMLVHTVNVLSSSPNTGSSKTLAVNAMTQDE